VSGTADVGNKKATICCPPVGTLTGETGRGAWDSGLQTVGSYTNSLILHQKQVVVQFPAQQQVWHMTVRPFTK